MAMPDIITPTEASGGGELRGPEPSRTTSQRIPRGGAASAASELAASEARHRAMFEHSPLPMWMIDRESFRFIAVNEAAVQHCGYTRDELASMTLADIRSGDDVAAFRPDAASPSGGPKQLCQHRTKDGRILTVETTASDFTLDGKEVRLVLVNDVTERERSAQALKRAEDQLQHAQKMVALGRLAGGVAHDFNNILTVVNSYASFLEDSLELSDTRRDDAAQIRRAADRGSAITRELLAVGSHAVARPRPIDLDELVAGFVPMLRRLVGPGITIVPLRGYAPNVLVDPAQMEQVLMNLAANARDAMPHGGRLTIASREVEIDMETAQLRGLRPGRHAELAVADTGTGMDRATTQQMNGPFVAASQADPGSGLGLAVTQGIVGQAGGATSVYSELGRGSTFRVYLPITEEVAGSERTVAIIPRTLSALRVLVVDAQAEVRAVAARILHEAGCSVLEAATAEEARRICVTHDGSIDLALLDVVLPDAHGAALIRQLRELRPTMKFIQMSGYPAGALASAGAAPDPVLAKPFTPSELRQHVARACPTAGEAAAQLSEVEPASAAAPRRALVADDDEILRRTLGRQLRRAGFEVISVESGAKAIAALETTAFDVVVSDVQMPDGDGLDVLRAIRRIDLDVPVVLITGVPSIATAAAAIEYGAFRFLTKPLDSDAFVKTVEHAARAHALARLRREAFHVSGAHVGVADRAGLEVRFEQAIDGMWMAFQPIVHAGTGALFGVEALMRSSEPSIPNPMALLEAADQLGRLGMLGRKVRALAAAAFAPQLGDVTLFVNLHPEDLYDLDLIARSSPLSMIASRVILEITERASLESTPQLTERLARLRELGFRIAVDDIGAGYSGLSSFTELTPEVVKIDMSLVRDVHKSAVKQRTIRALCQLCRDLGTLVVAEGIETTEERDTLVKLGCDLLQGYLLGRPNRDLPR
jgi:PAS domain S-box-containing protein